MAGVVPQGESIVRLLLIWVVSTYTYSIESPSRKEMQFQQHFLVALQAMSMAMFVVWIVYFIPFPSLIPFFPSTLTYLRSLQSLIRSLHPNTIFDQWEQLRANLHRRYKWSFKTAYDMCEFEPVVLEPDFTQFLREVHVIQDLGRERGQNEEIADNARDIKGNAVRVPGFNLRPYAQQQIHSRDTLCALLRSTLNLLKGCFEVWSRQTTLVR